MVNRSDSDERKALVLEVNRLLTAQPDTWGEPGDEEASINARKLALGLMFLRKIAKAAMLGMDMREAKACGATEAHDLIEALVLGGDHPILEYAQTIKTALPFRPKQAPAQTIISLLAIACMKVLRNRLGCGVGEAAELVAKRLNKLPSLRKLTAEALRKKEERLKDGIKEGEETSEEIEAVNTLVTKLLSEPDLDRSKALEWTATYIAYYSEPAHLMTEPDLRKLGFKVPGEKK